ncbi:hypothetical protein NC797_07990 [Aquibacillus sp. 3ASR75-11]|uniref:Uncharacterized protein n=1 Tax=Terrihalobacillus insolitus TaxID=2950438 RepID=A0A9X4ANE7_9BACI|nr:hypothetical protein [Terrihalobacillus insolitus]MDC3424448.1 hypothetical protein [Terrihalobacillus insolitus]
MKLFNTARYVCYQNLRKWTSNYRVWIVAILLIILTQNFTKEIIDFANDININVSPWLFPFLFTQKFIKLLFFFPLILLFSDAPFIDDNQPYVIARSGRIPWSVGQIGYIFVSTAIYFIFLIFLTIVINFSSIQFTSEWGKVLGTLANTNASVVVGLKTIIPSNTLYYFTPLQAMWFSLMLSWLAGVFLGLIIYVMNSLTNTRIFGILTASFFLVLEAAVNNRPELYRYSPISWSNLNRIDIDGTTQMPSITYIYFGFALLIVILIILAISSNRKQSINVLPPI